jgi:hypothetical protein
MARWSTSVSGGGTILLFYKEFEAADKFIKYDRYLKRLIRPLYNLLHHRQKKTGFRVSFDLLVSALKKAGYDVRVNDYRFARRHPDYPAGVIGFPCILDKWTLPNPALLGPSLYDHPGLAPDLFKDRRFRKYLVLADWTYDLFSPAYGDRCVKWHAGIDLTYWPDTRHEQKDIDFLVYDKIRWDHDQIAHDLLEPICARLERRGFKLRHVRYKYYDHMVFQTLLKRSKAMVFFCEHETQGLAYQEALASNVPVLAWDSGYWADPLWKRFSKFKIPASSVPFFSPACGETFAALTEFDAALYKFLHRLPNYEPREYVAEFLSMKKSANLYAEAYFSLLTELSSANMRA